MDETVRLATFNAENFYLLLDRDYSLEEFHALGNDAVQDMNHSVYNPNKALDKIVAAARMIREGDFDIVAMVEVGGMETLANFNRYYLDNAFDCFLHEVNSRRGIYVGALVRRGRFRHVRGRNVGVNFSRNLLELHVELGHKSLRVFVAHLKSHYGASDGIELRRREVEQLCRLVPTKRCAVMGDFNGIAIPGRQQFEFGPFLDLPFRDVLEALGMPEDERVTHYYFDPAPHFNQLDYIFCSNDLQVLDGGIVTDFVPATRDEREWLPSDHALLWAQIRPSRRG